MKSAVLSDKVPAAVGPYSSAVLTGCTVYVSGQLPINAATGAMPEGVEAQTAQSIANIEALLTECGMSLANVVKTTVYLKRIEDFSAMNAVYAERFCAPFPARSAFAVAALPKDALVEIECVACKSPED